MAEDTTDLRALPDTVTVDGLTETQRKQIANIMRAVVREYWAEETVSNLARTSARAVIMTELDDGIRGQVAELARMPGGAERMMQKLFERGGMLVKSEASKVFDDIVAGLLRDDEAGVPDLIRRYARDNLDMLVQRAVTEIVTAMVVEFLKGGAAGMACSVQDMMRQGFINASITPRY